MPFIFVDPISVAIAEFQARRSNEIARGRDRISIGELREISFIAFMSTLLGKENPNHSTSAFIENVVSGNNSNASSVASSPDDFDDDSATVPAFKANSIAAAATATSNILTNLSRLNAHHLSTTNGNYRKDMGGFSIPHHGLSAAFYGYHSHTSQMAAAAAANECLPTVASGSISPVEHGHHHHHHHHQHHHYSPNTTSSNGTTVSQQANATASTNASSGNGGNSSSSHTNNNAINNSSFNSNKSSPFLLPAAQLYKSLFANAVLHSPDKMCSHPFPRNLLFSYSDKSPNSPDFENDEKPTITTNEVSLMMFQRLRSRRLMVSMRIYVLFDSFPIWNFFCLLKEGGNALKLEQISSQMLVGWLKCVKQSIGFYFYQLFSCPSECLFHQRTDIKWNAMLQRIQCFESNWVLSFFFFSLYFFPLHTHNMSRSQQPHHSPGVVHRRLIWTDSIITTPRQTITTIAVQ